MPILLLSLRFLLAAVFLVAAVGKLLDRPGSRRAFVEFGVPERLSGPLAVALPAAELTVALALLPQATARWGALGALGLLLAFTGAIAYNLARGRRPDCHCFGQLYSAPAGRGTLVRNGALAALAAFLVWQGWDDPGPGPLDWAAGLSGGELLALTVGLGGLIAGGAVGWFTLQLMRRVDEGAKPIKDWDGPPYAPNGSGLYERDAKGRWWPTGAALEGGYQPCRACQRHGMKPADGM